MFRRSSVRVYRMRSSSAGGVRHGKAVEVSGPKYHATIKRRAAAVRGLQSGGVVQPDSVSFGHERVLWLQPDVQLPSVGHVDTAQWSVEQTLVFARSLLEALSEMHEGGLVHGQLDTATVRVRMSGGVPRAVITDIPPVVVSGWSEHAAPEVQLGEGVSSASDIFGAGYVIASVLSGRAIDGAGRHPSWLREEPGAVDFRLPAGAAWLAPLLEPLLRRRPEDRPYDAFLVAQQFARALGEASA